MPNVLKPNFLRQLAIITVLCSATWVHAADTLAEANKKIVLAFYDAALIRLDGEAARQYLGPQYIQHNPNVPDGEAALMGFIKFLNEKFPQRSVSIKRAMADGDLVMLHVHSKPSPEDRGSAIVDIFRVENGKIVEHWDVIQAVPETAKNNNSMF